MSINDRNRNRNRRVYGYYNVPPTTVNVAETNITRSFDANKIYVHRDCFIIRDSNGIVYPIPTDSYYGEYDEDFINFNNEFSKTVGYNLTFSSIPIVVLQYETGSTKVAFYVDSTSTSSLTVGLSAPFSGTLRYRAIYSGHGYPVVVENFPHHTSTYYYTASANQHVLNGDCTFVGNYADLGSIPSSFFATTYNNQLLNDTSVFVFSGTVGQTSTSIDLSSYIRSSVNIIAFK